MPMMLDPEQIKAGVEGSKSAMSTNFIISIFLGMSLQQMWSAINTMQIIFLMGLVEIRHQANLEQYFSVLSEYLQLELIELENSTPPDDPEQLKYESENDRILKYGYGSCQILFNSLSLGAGILINMTAAVVGKFMKNFLPNPLESEKLEKVKRLLRDKESYIKDVKLTPVELYTLQMFTEEDKPWLQRQREKFQDSFVYSALQVTIIEGTAEVSFCALIDILYFWQFYISQEYECSLSRFVSFASAVVLLTTNLVFLFLVKPIADKVYNYHQEGNLQNGSSEAFESVRAEQISARAAFLSENESVVQNFNPHSYWALVFNAIFIMRRMLLVLVLLFVRFNKFVQIQIFAHFSLAILLYLISKRPFTSKALMNMAFINESMTLLASYFFVMLNAISEQGIIKQTTTPEGDVRTDLFVGDPEQETSIANMIIQLLFLQFAINIVVVVSQSLQEAIVSCVKMRRKLKFDSKLKDLFSDYQEVQDIQEDIKERARYLGVSYPQADRIHSFEQFISKKKGDFPYLSNLPNPNLDFLAVWEGWWAPPQGQQRESEEKTQNKE
mmetsp:Transcript_41307/g.62916  ORF Transcript_41307/g.62916 Transcript_41307/m.62916 type:complete len:557 (-) Transcript_41307:731-2401(-)